MSHVKCSQFILLLMIVCSQSTQAVEVCQNNTFVDNVKPWGISKTDDMPLEQVEITDLEGVSYAMQADVKTPDPKSSWRCGLNQPIAQYIPKDAPIKLTFKAKGTADKKLRINLQTNGTPWDSTLSTNDIKLTEDWQTYTFEGKAKRDYVPGGLRIYVTFGQDAGMANITAIHVDVEGAGLPPSGMAINTNPYFDHQTSGWWYSTKRMDGKVIKEDQTPYVQLTLKEVDPDKSWEHSFNQRLVSPLPKGTKVLLQAIMRSPTADAKVDLYLQGKGGSKEQLIIAPGIRLTDNWQTFEFAATMPRDYQSNDCEITMHLGYQEQVIEIKQIKLSIVDHFESWLN